MCKQDDFSIKLDLTYHRDSDSYFLVLAVTDATGRWEHVADEGCASWSESLATLTSWVRMAALVWAQDGLPSVGVTLSEPVPIHPDQLRLL